MSPGSSRADALTRLRSAQKSNRGAAGYSRWVNRPLGRQLAALGYVLGLTPDQISLISATVTMSGVVLIAAARPTWPMAVLVVVLLVLGYALDSADGQVARLRGGGSPAGEWLDHVLDAVKLATIHLAVAVAWFRFFGLRHEALLLIPLGFSAATTAFFFALVLVDMMRRIRLAGAGVPDVATASRNPRERAPVLRSLIVLPNDYGVLCLTMVLLPLHRTFVVIYTVLLAANLVFLATGCLRWFHELRGATSSSSSMA